MTSPVRSIWFTERQWEDVCQEARREGVSASSWVRVAAIAKVLEEKARRRARDADG